MRVVHRVSAWTFLLSSILALGTVAVGFAGTYPPPASPAPPKVILPTHRATGPGPIFSNTHSYAWSGDPNAVVIRVDVYNNYFGDFSKYWWVYTVTNNSYEPVPGFTNGFSGFELTLPAFVPDIADISAPDGIPPWLINCCSGLPVEWDLTNSGGAGVGGGTLPGQTEIYAFTTSPRLVTQSTGWFHTWYSDSQWEIINYPPGNGPEVPDVISDPGQERCCHMNALGMFICEVLPAGQCTAIGGTLVTDCDHCPPVTPAKKKSWGKVKSIYR